ncbi:MAG: hypothetical protein PHT62_00330 [Desulfotomaculaceae bacterium]|nr:hypothetical protein [Desulfotomaculaceae bacterium]
MSLCPLAFIDPCSECAHFGKCSPSQAVQKIVDLENTVQELKMMLQDLIEKK